MSVTKEEILEGIASMSVMEVVKLIEMMEEKFGVTAAAPVAVAAQAAAAPAAEEKTEFNIILKSFGADKVKVIKTVREITGLGLKEAKDMVEAAPTAVVKEGVSKAEAADIKKKLEESGAEAEVK